MLGYEKPSNAILKHIPMKNKNHIVIWGVSPKRGHPSIDPKTLLSEIPTAGLGGPRKVKYISEPFKTRCPYSGQRRKDEPNDIYN